MARIITTPIFIVLLAASWNFSFPLLCSSFSTQSPIVSRKSLLGSDEQQTTSNLIFPGGGIFFYWQAGVISYLREKNYPLAQDQIKFTGASAGALCATLTAANVDFEFATKLALDKSREAGIWDRPLGLYGIWGPIIDTWLDELLPDDKEVLDQVNNKVNILVTRVPSFQKAKISQFESKRDLIKANMASVHIPFFLNGKITTDFRSAPHIDGSFLTKPEDYHLGDKSLILDWQVDPFLRDRNLGDAVQALSEDGIWDLVERGRNYAVQMEKDGAFDHIFSSPLTTS